MTLQRCATCAWWRRQAPCLSSATRSLAVPYEEGTCHRNAPAVVNNGGLAVSLFPTTHESRFCGQWTAQPTGGGSDDGERVIAFPPPANRIAA